MISWNENDHRTFALRITGALLTVGGGGLGGGGVGGGGVGGGGVGGGGVGSSPICWYRKRKPSTVVVYLVASEATTAG